MKIVKCEVRWSDMYGADDIRGFATVVVATSACPCENVMQLNIRLMDASKDASAPVERIISNEIVCMTNDLMREGVLNFENEVRSVMTRRKIKPEAYLREDEGMNQMLYA